MKHLKTIYCLIFIFFTNNTFANITSNEVIVFTENLVDGMYNIKDQKDLTNAQKSKRVGLYVISMFETEKAAKSLLQQNWNKLTKEDQKLFLRKYPNYLLETLSPVIDSVLEVKKESIKINKKIINKGMIADIFIDFKDEDNENQRMALTLIKKDNKFRIIDISIGGITLISSQRSIFEETIEDNGLRGIFDLIS